MPQNPRRIILKLSGEALRTDESPFSHELFVRTAKALIQLKETGAQLAVVIGGGNVWRGRRGPSMQMGAVAADQMGMLATLQNCLYMRDTLSKLGCDAIIMTAVDMPRFAEPYNTVKAISYLEGGTIVLLACGLGNPYFSTDSAIALRALELECDEIYMAKNVDGVYEADPKKVKGAKLIPELTYAEAIGRELKVMDMAAMILLNENRFPLLRVFGLDEPENILTVARGEVKGSVLHP